MIALNDVVSYSVEPGESGVAVGCVLRFAPNQRLTRDDVLVSRVEQLDSSLTLGVSEELLSNVINITVVSDVAQVLLTTTLCLKKCRGCFLRHGVYNRTDSSRQFTANNASCLLVAKLMLLSYPTNHCR